MNMSTKPSGQRGTKPYAGIYKRNGAELRLYAQKPTARDKALQRIVAKHLGKCRMHKASRGVVQVSTWSLNNPTRTA